MSRQLAEARRLTGLVRPGDTLARITGDEFVMLCPGVDPESFVHARYIILWACNTLSTNSHHWPFIEQAKKNGAKLVVIDPVKTRTARLADWQTEAHVMEAG